MNKTTSGLTPKTRQSPLGFTIVELLIVIVIIAILAAIVTVTYTGIQIRAENDKTLAVVSSYAKMVTTYIIDNSTPPGPLANTCIGVSPCGLMSGTGGDSCDIGQGRPSRSDTLDNNLKSSLGVEAIPSTSSQQINCGTGMYTGAWYWTNGASSRMTFYLRGDQVCPVLAGATGTVRTQNADATRCTVFFS